MIIEDDKQIEGLKIITPTRYIDERGSFSETYSQKEFAKHNIFYNFVQDNESISCYGVVRGLHYQDFPEGQVKLVRCTEGEIFDVAVDVRPTSKTYGQYRAVILSENNRAMFLIPKGFLHGFCVLSNRARVNYKCSWYYEPTLEKSIKYDDKTLNIDWPKIPVILSEKDKSAPSFLEVFPSIK